MFFHDTLLKHAVILFSHNFAAAAKTPVNAIYKTIAIIYVPALIIGYGWMVFLE
ncbi:MAG: hypothetical protein HAW59_07055 [Betaproteobacteria bacterium]|nr:hypothetical protein [Betaproteobacteria bacterium]